jgi:hypothetical protein
MSTEHADPLRPPDPAAAEVERHYTTTAGKLSLWTGVLGGAVAWMLQLQAGYVLSRFSHEHRWLTTVHHAVSAAAVLLAVGAALLAWRDWRRLGNGRASGTEGGVVGRSRFLAGLGMFASALFAVVILGDWVPTFFLDPAWY